MPEGMGILERLGLRRGGSTDARQTTINHRDEQPLPLPTPTPDADLPVRSSVQPGDTATELHPTDQQAMDERAAQQARHNDIAAQAALSGLQATHPVEPVGPRSTFKPSE